MNPPRLAFVALLLLGSLATPAAAELTAPTGSLCGFAGVGDMAEFEAGPLSLVDEDDPAVPHTATITCSIQATGFAHSEPDWLTVTSVPGTGVAYLPPTLVPTPEPWPWWYTYCTRLDVVGEPTLYWHQPSDRNSDGWWTTDPNARCEDNLDTLDIRSEDPPQGYVYSALATVGGELDTAVDVVEPVICAEPALDPVTDVAWQCGVPATSSAVSFVRTPAATVLRTMPFGWTCTDAHTGLGVTRGSSLTVPDPGVSCTPPAGYDVWCGWAEVSGYLAPATLGRVDVTVACDTHGVTRRLAAAQARLVEQWSGAYAGRPPLRCTAREDTTGPVEPSYVVFCSIT